MKPETEGTRPHTPAGTLRAVLQPCPGLRCLGQAEAAQLLSLPEGCDTDAGCSGKCMAETGGKRLSWPRACQHSHVLFNFPFKKTLYAFLWNLALAVDERGLAVIVFMDQRL